MSPPNILFVFFDNLGYGELGVYGGGVVRDHDVRCHALSIAHRVWPKLSRP